MAASTLICLAARFTCFNNLQQTVSLDHTYENAGKHIIPVIEDTSQP